MLFKFDTENQVKKDSYLGDFFFSEKLAIGKK